MKIGQKLKALRKKLNLTLSELAQRTELTPGFISQVERDLCSPSIETLSEILEVLGISLGDFFAYQTDDITVYHAPQRFVHTADHYEQEWLISKSSVLSFEPIMITIKPQQRWAKIEPAEADLFLYLLQGSIIVKTIKESQRCQATDSVYVKLNETVTIINCDKTEAVVLAVSDPPIF